MIVCRVITYYVCIILICMVWKGLITSAAGHYIMLQTVIFVPACRMACTSTLIVRIDATLCQHTEILKIKFVGGV